MESDETYFRKYLVDPLAIVQQTPTGMQTPQVPDSEEPYYRRYLVDPNA